MERERRLLLVQVSGFVDDFDAHVVEQVLVGRAVEAEVDPGVGRCDLEIVFREDVVLPFLERKEVACVLLVLESFLSLEVLLLRYDGYLPQGRPDEDRESERSMHIGFNPESFLVGVLRFQA